MPWAGAGARREHRHGSVWPSSPTSCATSTGPRCSCFRTSGTRQAAADRRRGGVPRPGHRERCDHRHARLPRRRGCAVAGDVRRQPARGASRVGPGLDGRRGRVRAPSRRPRRPPAGDRRRRLQPGGHRPPERRPDRRRGAGSLAVRGAARPRTMAGVPVVVNARVDVFLPTSGVPGRARRRSIRRGGSTAQPAPTASTRSGSATHRCCQPWSAASTAPSTATPSATLDLGRAARARGRPGLLRPTVLPGRARRPRPGSARSCVSPARRIAGRRRSRPFVEVSAP